MIRALRFRLILVALIASFACVGFAVGQQVSPVDDAAVSDLVGSSERIVAERMLRVIQAGDVNALNNCLPLIQPNQIANIEHSVLYTPNVEVFKLLSGRWNMKLDPAQVATILGNREQLEQWIAAEPESGQRIKDLDLVWLATLHNRPELIRLFASSGAAVDDTYYPYRFTPLSLAAEHGHIEAMEMLISIGANANLLADYTPLQRACLTNQKRAATLLIKHGADVNIARHDGQTALHLAAKRGSADCVRVLLEAGADRSAKNASGETPLAEAQRRQNREVIHLLQNEK